MEIVRVRLVIIAGFALLSKKIDSTQRWNWDRDDQTDRAGRREGRPATPREPPCPAEILQPLSMAQKPKSLRKVPLMDSQRIKGVEKLRGKRSAIVGVRRAGLNQG